MSQNETYYDILKVERKATISEIVAAYHAAKNAFSRDSVATYSLFSSEEIKGVLYRLEEAYLSLSNIDKKREYDRWLDERAESGELPPAMTELERKQKAHPLPREMQNNSMQNTPSNTQNIFAPVTSAPAPEAAPQATPVPDGTPILLVEGEELTGPKLREIREKRALSIDDVSRITKIPTKFIRSIEADDFKHHPARVYLQGFVKNMATLYKLDSKTVLKQYFDYIDKFQTAPAA